MYNDGELIGGLEKMVEKIPIKKWILSINGPYEIKSGPDNGGLTSPEYIFTTTYRSYQIRIEGTKLDCYPGRFVGIKLSVSEEKRSILDEEDLESIKYRDFDKARKLFEQLYLRYSDYQSILTERREKRREDILKRKEQIRKQTLKRLLKSFD